MKYNIYFDEVGRGCVAGRLYTCFTVKLKDFDYNMFKDSKKLTEKKRNTIYDDILKLQQNNFIKFGFGIVDNKEIDEINDMNISMKTAIFRGLYDVLLKLGENITIKDFNKYNNGSNFYNFTDFINLLIMDGNTDFGIGKYIPTKTIIKGDNKERLISASSIIAKVTRDNEMINYSRYEKYNKYLFEKNKGYLSKEHKDALIKYGISNLHRKSFLKKQKDILKNN